MHTNRFVHLSLCLTMQLIDKTKTFGNKVHRPRSIEQEFACTAFFFFSFHGLVSLAFSLRQDWGGFAKIAFVDALSLKRDGFALYVTSIYVLALKNLFVGPFFLCNADWTCRLMIELIDVLLRSLRVVCFSSDDYEWAFDYIRCASIDAVIV